VDHILRETTGTSIRELGSRMVREAHVRTFPRNLLRTLVSTDPTSDRLAQDHRQLKVALSTATGAELFVDSSKEMSRGLFLLWADPACRVVLLVRHPISVVQSYRWRLGAGKPFKLMRKLYFPRSSLGKAVALGIVYFTWTVGAVLGEVVRLRYRGRLQVVRYEDLAARPRAVLEELGRGLRVDLSEVCARIERTESFPLGHQVGGNELRHGDDLVFSIGSAPVRSSTLERVLAWALCWPGMLRYGYR
jgi:hypothetical protein